MPAQPSMQKAGVLFFVLFFSFRQGILAWEEKKKNPEEITEQELEKLPAENFIRLTEEKETKVPKAKDGFIVGDNVKLKIDSDRKIYKIGNNLYRPEDPYRYQSRKRDELENKMNQEIERFDDRAAELEESEKDDQKTVDPETSKNK